METASSQENREGEAREIISEGGYLRTDGTREEKAVENASNELAEENAGTFTAEGGGVGQEATELASEEPGKTVGCANEGKSKESDEDTDSPSHVASTLKLSWVFGFNRHVPVHNLSAASHKSILYAAGHVAVIYDLEKNSQTHLEGHRNNINCLSVSGDGRWIATADIGPDSTVVMWDACSSIPVQTYFQPHIGGVSALAVSDDAKYLVTIGYKQPRDICVWDWTSTDDLPVATLPLPLELGLQTSTSFNVEDVCQLMTQSDSSVSFYLWEGKKIVRNTPDINDKTFNRVVGRFTQTVFLAGQTRALTSTTEGNVIVWHCPTKTNSSAGKSCSVLDLRLLKLVNLQTLSLTTLVAIDKMVVTGDSMGNIYFYDEELKLRNWYDDLNHGPVSSISFSSKSIKAETSGAYPGDATISARRFTVPDFVVSTSNAVITHIQPGNRQPVSTITREFNAAVACVAAHPQQPYVAIGAYSGLLKLWNYETKSLIHTRQFGKQMLQCLAFDPAGNFLAVGFTDGVLRVVDCLSLDDVCTAFRYSRDCVTMVRFSQDSQYLATADADMCVSLYCFNESSLGDEDINSKEQCWFFLAKHRSHYKKIQSIVFGRTLDKSAQRLLSVGEDRVLIEYDLANSSKDNLLVLSMERIEQSAVPFAMDWYPSFTSETFLLTANDQYKYKLYNCTTKMCRKTILGPTYGGPVTRMTMLSAQTATDAPAAFAQRSYMAFATDEKVGVTILPLDGNPFSSMALIAHPSGVSTLASSSDGEQIFTGGGTDACVFMWTFNSNALEAARCLGGEDLEPFYTLLDGGREGHLFAEMEDFFYYSQLRSQGLDSTETREVSSTIPLSEIPFVMRSLGFYPTEHEVENMLNEVQFGEFTGTSSKRTDIDLRDFIKLYVNHRPVFGLSPQQLNGVFTVLGKATQGGQEGSIQAARLIQLLESKGEHITKAELADCFSYLFDREGDDTESAPDKFPELPDRMTAEQFAEEVLGFGQ